MSRYVNLDEKVTAQFYDEEHEEWFVKEVTVEEILSICDSYTEVDAEPVRHGHWINGDCICPCCGKDKFKDLDADIWSDWQPKFCPNCGAKMDAEEKEDVGKID